MTLNSDSKFESTLTLWFQFWHEEFGELSLKHSKILKFVILWALFVKSVMLQVEYFTGIMCHDTKIDAKFR